MTAEQYGNTLRDLLGDDTSPGDKLGEDLAGDSGFTQPGSVSSLEVSRFLDAAESAAMRATKDLPKLLGCDPARTGEDACIKGWLPGFARRAYRRPLDAEEIDKLTRYYAEVRARDGQTTADAVRVVVATVLQSPNFLYRWELGAAAPRVRGGVVALTDHELASRLSYFLWNSMPDEELFAAADARTLTKPGELATQARRMLASDKARGTIVSFHEQWLGLQKVGRVEKDPVAYPTFDDTLRAAMIGETRAFIEHVFFSGDGRLDTLLGAPFTFVNDTLAKTYGMTGVTGTSLRRQDVDPKQRFGGILTQPGFLTAHAQPSESSPVKRGVTLREKVMCQNVPAPPAMMFEAPVPDPKVSVREQFAQHSADPGCRACHRLIDALGFGLENFDGIGKYRASQAGHAVDSSGNLEGLASGAVDFPDGSAMMASLRGSPEVRRCVATQWLRFALRRADGTADESSLDAVYQAFAGSQFDLRELIAAIVVTPSFRFRARSEGEVVQ